MRTLLHVLRAVGLSALLLAPAVASAHAFGQQYTLPVPLAYYAVGASGALLASFAAFFFLGRSRALTVVGAPKTLTKLPNIVLLSSRSIGVLLLTVTIAVGFFGTQTAALNLAPMLFWIFLLLGVTYTSALVSGVWRALNPFESISRLLLGASYGAPMRYPRWLGVTPALALFYVLIKMELLSLGVGAQPAVVATMLVVYLIVSLIGAIAYGVDEWFEKADFFNVFFGLIGKMAPMEVSREGVLSLRSPASELSATVPADMSVTLFVMFVLSSTAFDGLRETQVWADMFYSIDWVVRHPTLFNHFVLLFSPLLFFALYALALYLMKFLTGGRHAFGYLVLRFTLSLVPIAVAYSFAHYFMLLVTGAQTAFALISDPLGLGWNVLGTANYQPNIALIGARMVWNIQIAVIVIGHVVATYVAHKVATLEYERTRDVLVGQIPMLLLMVCYTVFGLWLLSLAFATP